MAIKKAAAPIKAAKAAPKKATAAKKCAPKVVAKAPAKPAAKKTGTVKGNKYACATCGLVVTVDTVCDCVGVCDIFCCGKPMATAKR